MAGEHISIVITVNGYVIGAGKMRGERKSLWQRPCISICTVTTYFEDKLICFSPKIKKEHSIYLAEPRNPKICLGDG